MPHENTNDNNGEAEKAAQRIREAFHKVEAIVNGDDLVPQVKRRRVLKKAASTAKNVHTEHPVRVLLAEVFLVVVTFGIVRRFKKSS